MPLGAPELAGRLAGAAEASLATLPIRYYAADRKPIERFERTIAERLPADRLACLRQKGAALGLEEAIQRILGFTPTVS